MFIFVTYPRLEQPPLTSPTTTELTPAYFPFAGVSVSTENLIQWSFRPARAAACLPKSSGRHFRQNWPCGLIHSRWATESGRTVPSASCTSSKRGQATNLGSQNITTRTARRQRRRRPSTTRTSRCWTLQPQAPSTKRTWAMMSRRQLSIPRARAPSGRSTSCWTRVSRYPLSNWLPTCPARKFVSNYLRRRNQKLSLKWVTTTTATTTATDHKPTLKICFLLNGLTRKSDPINVDVEM